MPIVNLTTHTQPSVTQALPRLATLYKGAPRPEDGKRPGKDLDYFRVEFNPEYAHLAPVWADLYGPQPKMFPHVYLTAPGLDDAFPTWMEEWSASAMLRRCDGETQVLQYDASLGRCREASAPCLRESGGCDCRRIGRLAMFLPDFCAQAGIIGWVTLSTHSVLDILNLYNYLNWIGAGGRRSLMGIEFILGRAPRTVSFFDEKQQRRLKVKKSLLYLTATPDYVQRVLLPAVTSGEMAAQPPALEAGSLPALPAGELDEGDVIEGSVEDEPGDPPDPKNPPPPQQQKPPAQGKNGKTAGNGKPPASPKTDWRTGQGAALVARMRALKLTQHPADKLVALLEEMGDLVDLKMTADLLVRRMKAYKTGELKRPDPPPAPDAGDPGEPPDIEDGESVEDSGENSGESPAVQMLDCMIPTVAQMRGRKGPFIAALVRDFIAEQVEQITGGKPGWKKIAPTDHQKHELAQLFAEASAAKKAKDKEAERHAIISWLVGKDGISELDLAEWQALVFWLEGETEGQIHPQAYLEYALVLEAAQDTPTDATTPDTEDTIPADEDAVPADAILDDTEPDGETAMDDPLPPLGYQGEAVPW